MSDDRRPAAFGLRFARQLWGLVRVYWTSADALWGLLLLTLAIGLELGTVWGSVWVADAERRILDSLSQRQVPAFLEAVSLFLGASLAFVLLSAYRVYIRQALEIRWRAALTSHYVEHWVSPHAYLQPELHGGEMDNPEQRIQEDVRDFVASALGLSLSLLAAVATLVSFGGVLWSLSANWSLHFRTVQLRVPGFMLWLAVAYGLLSTWVTHLVGRQLIPINFDRLRVEADFRYGLTRFRDNAEAVALSRGEATERQSAATRFRYVIDNWWRLIGAQRNLTLLTTGIGQANNVVPVVVAVPAYFARLISLGTIVQIRIAYGQVSGALAWFVFAYQEIARWRANVERLSTFADVMAATARECASAGIEIVPTHGTTLRLTDLRIQEPDGRILLDGANAVVHAGDRVAVLGPSGTGKTLLIRAMAGIWLFGAGRIEVPSAPHVLFAKQWPYIPAGTLRAAVSYPAPEGTFPDEQVTAALRLLGLERFATRLGAVESWDQILSPHEQQRLALTRILLHEPEWLFLDKSTSALDEDTEREVYRLLAERLPHATIFSIAHRPEVAQYHRHRWTFVPQAGRVALDVT